MSEIEELRSIVERLKATLAAFNAVEWKGPLRLDHYDPKPVDQRGINAQQHICSHQAPYADEAVAKGLETMLRYVETNLRDLERYELQRTLKAKGLPEDFQDAVKALLGGTK